MYPDFSPWLRLEQTPGVGAGTARKLLTAFGLPEQIFACSYEQLAAEVGPRIAKALLQPPSPALLALTEKTYEWCQQANNYVLTLADSNYPSALLEIPDPPVVLYVKGCLDLLSSPGIGVVGSRHATAQGIRNAELFSETLSHAGLTISSGLAAGIDAAAHQGALRGMASTVAVIGTGADIVYPARNRELAHAIAESGCIVSEYSLGSPALASNFPRRNRIISGLALGVLVIEAAAQSGSLITARMAVEQGREVFAIPGSIHSPLAKGCHQLIKQGAKLVESAQDILEELKFSLPKLKDLSGTTPESELSHVNIPASGLLANIAFDPTPMDTLALVSGLDMGCLNAQLLNLELDGQIEALPGGLYRRLA
ncbi:DNA-processing protein DprA [Undibacterium sp. Dicai25W]|uniref:DNA-processing protein DprA n=1 Tax=Undibacterium sp. Dicai25W TaxID=3413034 RepID=UPI003BF1E232